MITVDQECVLGLRQMNERCICRANTSYYGTVEDPGYIWYRKRTDDMCNDLFVGYEDEYIPDENKPDVVRLYACDPHPTLNPTIGDCFCCGHTVYHLDQRRCQDCNVLLCRDCVLRETYDQSVYVCYLCRVQVTKNTRVHYSADPRYEHATSACRLNQLDHAD